MPLVAPITTTPTAPPATTLPPPPAASYSNTTPFPTTSNCYSGVFDAWTIALPIDIKKSNICILELWKFVKLFLTFRFWTSISSVMCW